VVASNIVVTITNPDGSTETITHALDGTLLSDTGTAVTSTTGSSGVINFGGSDARGLGDANVQSNSTWTSLTTNGTNNTTTTYTNMLGQVYLVQKTQPGTALHQQQAVTDAITSFDGDGRVIKYIDFDGTTTYTSYDPFTGQIANAFTDMNRNGVYDVGVDRKSVSKVGGTSLLAAGAAATSEGLDFSNTGIDDAFESVQLTDSGANAGSDEITTENGLTSETKTPPAATGSNGAWTSTTTNPDGTKVVDTYADGLLAEEKVLPVSGTTAITDTTFTYDGLRRLSGKTDFTGTTSYTYFQDGTQASVHEPGHDPVMVNAVDVKNDSTTQTQRSSNTGDTVNTPKNSQAQTSAQSGKGVLPATYGYDTTGTGQLTSLITYQGTATFSGTTITGTGATTNWGYDQATGQLSSKTYADGSSYQYQYNNKFQLSNVIEPGITASSFTYNNAGQQVSSSMTDSTTGKVAMSVTGFDEMGRPMSISDTDNGHTYTTTNITDDHQRPKQTMFGSAGNATVNYDYAATDSNVSTESRGALTTMTLKAGSGSTLATTSYGYDSSSKRLSTISVNGVTFTFNYFSDSNQISSVVTTATGGSGVTTTYLRDSGDKSRISQVGVQSGNSSVGQVFQEQAVSNGAYPSNGFNQQDQIVGQTTTWKDAADDGTLSSTSVKDYLYGYNPNLGDALTSVTDGGTSATLNTYSFDNVGNRTGTSLGTVNSVNEYSGLTYNQRGDVTGDGTNAYGYDAQDRMISVMPLSPASGSTQEKYGYDAQGRRLWKTVATWTSGAWAPSYARHYLWDGSNLVAELDGNNAMVIGYTWGPTGLIAVTDYTPTSGGPKTYQVVQDLSGNIVELVDPISGNLAASYHYDSWGLQTSAAGPAKAVSNFRGKGYFFDPESPFIGGAPQPGNGNTHVLNFQAETWMQRDRASESQVTNPLRPLSGDPINNVDPNGLSSRPDALRPQTQVWNEAKADIASMKGLGPNTPWNQVVEKGLVFDTTYGDLVTKSYKAKVDWYFNVHGIFVEPDRQYAAEVADYWAGHQETITADNRTVEEIHSSEELYEIKRSGINPQAVLAAEIAQRHSNPFMMFIDCFEDGRSWAKFGD
jgi:YD repeat-containing protein